MEDSVVVLTPLSFIAAARYVRRRDASILVAMSARYHWIAWKEAMGCSNWRRSLEYASEASNAPCDIPSAGAPIEMRPPSRTFIASTKPSPSFPTRFSAGMRQSSMTISGGSLGGQPGLFGWGGGGG